MPHDDLHAEVIRPVEPVVWAPLVRDRVEAIERDYRDIGRPVTNEALSTMRAFPDGRPQGGHEKHDYQRANEFAIAEERQKYRRYQEYFKVPNEV